MNDALFNATFLPTESDARARVLESITGRQNGKNMPGIAADLGIGLGVVRVIIKRSIAAGVVQFNGPPTRYFVE